MTGQPRARRERSGRATDGPGVRAWAALLRVHATLLPLLDRELRGPTGLPVTWYDVLLVLNAAPDRRLTMSELGQAALVTRTRASRVVDDMAKVGLVERVANPADGRSSFAGITDAGRTALRKAAPVYLDGIRRHFTEHLDPEEAEVIARGLTKVADAISRAT